MTQKPILDYQPKPATLTRRERASRLTVAAACALAGPSVLCGLSFIFANPVSWRWLSGHQFNLCLEAAGVCNAIGLVPAFAALWLGKATAGGVLFLVHMVCLLLIPSLAYG
jgi:hypothetical protein